MSQPRFLRHPIAAAALAVAVVFVGACAGGSTDDATAGADGPAGTEAATTVAATAPAGGTYGVGRTDLTLVDPTRGTDAAENKGLEATDDRTLPTVVLYPTEDTDADATDDTDPVAPGRFPVFLFAHGVISNGEKYIPRLESIAAAGYVLVLPTFPLSSDDGGFEHVGDVANQPADVSFVLDEVLALGEADDGLLAGHLDPDAVAVGGHSLGAITVLNFYDPCCVDDRIDAVVALSGASASSFDDDQRPVVDIPLLLLHGEQDELVPYEGGSVKIFDTFVEIPRGLVSFGEGDHNDLRGTPTANGSMTAFLDLVLRDDPTRWEELGALIEDNGDATIEVAGGLPDPAPAD